MLLTVVAIAASAPSAELAEASSGSWPLLVVFFCFAIGVSFFCSVWESVLLSVTHPYIDHLRSERPRAGERLALLKRNIGRPLTSILTLNTIANTAGAMGVAAQISMLGGGRFDALAGGAMTLCVLIAAEIIPKNLGARHWRRLAPWVGLALTWLTRLMTPVVALIELFSKDQASESTFSRDELKVMAQMGSRQGKLQEDESRIIENLLRLGEISVREVMTPRVVVFALAETTTVKKYFDRHTASPFSRIPIYSENRDDIGGFVLKDDILLAAARDHFDLPLSELRREIATIPETTKLTNAFQYLVTNHHHIVLVLDEFGGMSGLVTMEDVVETLLGMEIVDELDVREDMQEFARNLWKLRAARMGLEVSEPSPSAPVVESVR